MSHPVIQVQGLGKEYVIGGRESGRETFREMLTSSFAAPFRRLRRLKGEVAAEERIWALKDVSFEVAAGEVVGIVGRNGAGKSTLLKILSRITEPTEGRVEIRGRVASLLEVGTGFHPELTGRENVYLNAAILGMSRAEIDRKFAEIVAFAEIDKFLDTPVKRYSSGMQVRLAFAVAAHLEPEILIVDEVLAVGDAEFQKRCLGKMKDVAGHGRTVLFVSHNMNAVQQLCNRAIWLDAGQVQMESDDVREVKLRYLHIGENQHSAEWVNPGDQFQDGLFVPRRFFIGDADGVPVQGPIANNEDVFVYIEGVLRQAGPAFVVGYDIYIGEDQLLYRSRQTDTFERCWPILTPGHVCLRSDFPKRLLNEGKYRLELVSGVYDQEWIIEPGSICPVINIEIQGGLSDSPFWLGRRPGLLAPVLYWKRHSSTQN